MTYDLLVKNASELLTCQAKKPKTKEQLNDLSLIKNGAVLIHQGKIVIVGETKDFTQVSVQKVIDVKKRVVMPGFVDSHTHLVFAGSREDEFEDKIKGKSYLEILASGGGIFSTVKKTRATDKPTLIKESLKKLDQLLNYGTTTVEIKTGYGLSYQEELKLLECIDDLREKHSIDIVKTFLGAHVYPEGKSKSEYKKELFKMVDDFDYDFCDIFIEKEAFSVSDAKEILKRALLKGKKVKIHADQFSFLGGSLLAADLKATSVDHLDYIEAKAIKELSGSETIGILLPGVSFFLRAKKLPPVREMMESGMILALGSDFNPGSCPTFNMQLIISFACIMYGISPAQAINMVTINAAFAAGLKDRVGSLAPGKQADILVLDVDTYKKLPYFFGINHVDIVIKKGKMLKPKSNKHSPC